MTTAPTTSPNGTTTETMPLQPLLNDALIVLRAPTQVWSDATGAIGTAAVHGVYHGDVRHVSALTASCDDSPIEWISTAPDGASRVVFGGLLRGVDDTTPDPKVRLMRDRRVDDGLVSESWIIRSRVDRPLRTTLRLRLTPEFAQLHEVKSGHAHPEPPRRCPSERACASTPGPRDSPSTPPGPGSPSATRASRPRGTSTCPPSARSRWASR